MLTQAELHWPRPCTSPYRAIAGSPDALKLLAETTDSERVNEATRTQSLSGANGPARGAGGFDSESEVTLGYFKFQVHVQRPPGQARLCRGPGVAKPGKDSSQRIITSLTHVTQFIHLSQFMTRKAELIETTISRDSVTSGFWMLHVQFLNIF